MTGSNEITMKKPCNKLDLEEVISICREYKEIFSFRHTSYGSSPDEIIKSCEKLKVLGFAWGDKLPSGDFRISNKYYLSNSATKYKPKQGTYYIEWDNGNIGRYQFVNEMYYHLVDDEWAEFLKEMMSYNPVDYDPINCHIIYEIENGKMVMADYESICDRTMERMKKKIRSFEIEKKKSELKKLMEEQSKD